MRLDFSDQADLKVFFKAIMPDHIVNKHGQNEDALAYLIRHSQLLPRELISLFNGAIRLSYEETSSWRSITAGAVVKAVEETEDYLREQVLKPFRDVYPDLTDAIEAGLEGVHPICSLSDLHKAEQKLPRGVKREANWDIMYQMGVLGYIDPEKAESRRSYYEYGLFHFNSLHSIKFANHITYCFHPLFSSKLRTKRPPGMKFVYPAKIEDLW